MKFCNFLWAWIFLVAVPAARAESISPIDFDKLKTSVTGLERDVAGLRLTNRIQDAKAAFAGRRLTAVEMKSESEAEKLRLLELKVIELEKLVTLNPLPLVAPACTDARFNLRQVPIGFQCLSQRGFLFTKVSRPGFVEAWKGPDGVIWSAYLGNANIVTKICSDKGAILPPTNTVSAGVSYGVHEVLVDFINTWHWTSTGSVNNYVKFYTRDGKIDFIWAQGGYNYAIRCVELPPNP